MTVVDLYTIQIINDVSPKPLDVTMGANVVRQIIEEAEENLSDLLPAGYRARIRRWDHPGTEDENDE